MRHNEGKAGQAALSLYIKSWSSFCEMADQFSKSKPRVMNQKYTDLLHDIRRHLQRHQIHLEKMKQMGRTHATRNSGQPFTAVGLPRRYP